MVLRTDSNWRNTYSRQFMKSQLERQESSVFEPKLHLFFPFSAQWGRNRTVVKNPGLTHPPAPSQMAFFLRGTGCQDFSFDPKYPLLRLSTEKWGLLSTQQMAMRTYRPESKSMYCGTVPIMYNDESNWDFISLIFSLTPSHSSRSRSGNSRRLSNLKEQNSKELIKLGRILEVPGKMRKSLTFGSSYISLLFQQ